MTASTANMWGAIAALSVAARPYYDEVHRTYGERRAFFYDAFTRMGLPQKPTAGAFVGMVDIRRHGRSEDDVAEAFLTDARVLIWPGTVFGACGKGYLRVSLIKPLATLQEMIRRVEPIVAGMLATVTRTT